MLDQVSKQLCMPHARVLNRQLSTANALVLTARRIDFYQWLWRPCREQEKLRRAQERLDRQRDNGETSHMELLCLPGQTYLLHAPSGLPAT